MNKNTEKKVRRMIINNIDGKYDIDIYNDSKEYLTEDFIREMKEYINFDELFERRYISYPNPILSKDFLNELKEEKNFGEWMSKESGIRRYVRTGDCSDLKTDLIDNFKNEILNYAKTLDEDGVNDYYDFFNNYDDEMKEWINEYED